MVEIFSQMQLEQLKKSITETSLYKTTPNLLPTKQQLLTLILKQLTDKEQRWYTLKNLHDFIMKELRNENHELYKELVHKNQYPHQMSAFKDGVKLIAYGYLTSEKQIKFAFWATKTNIMELFYNHLDKNKFCKN